MAAELVEGVAARQKRALQAARELRMGGAHAVFRRAARELQIRGDSGMHAIADDDGARFRLAQAQYSLGEERGRRLQVFVVCRRREAVVLEVPQGKLAHERAGVRRRMHERDGIERHADRLDTRRQDGKRRLLLSVASGGGI